MSLEVCGVGDEGAAKVASLRATFAAMRVPGFGSIELTARCNLRCVHCYHGTAGRRSGAGELSTKEWLSVLDQVAGAGCLYLLITGGDPFLRRDFDVIYRRAKSLGMLVTVFTNGTLISPSLLDLFQDLPPQSIEITLYGASERVYREITGAEGAFRRCLSGVDALLEKGVRVGLKTVLLTKNIHELEKMRGLAVERDVSFRLDAGLFPRFNGDRSPLDLRVPPEEAVSKELEDPRHLRQLRDFWNKARNLPSEKMLYSCGAGKTAFHVDASGRLSPCLMIQDPVWDLRESSFEEGWSTLIAGLDGIKASEDYRCGSCEKRTLCAVCPAFSELEMGSPEAVSPYLCAMGEERYRTVVENGLVLEGEKG